MATGEADSGHAPPEGVSIILPTLNLADGIGQTIGALRDELLPIASSMEFVVVDDGSTDDTATVVNRLCRVTSDVRLLRNQRNLGKGVSVYLGVLASRYPKVCFTDADLPFAPGSYARVIERLLRGCPFAVASRRMPDSEILVRMEVLGYAARRHLIGVAFNRLVRFGLRLPYRDTQCGLKAFDRQVGIELLQRVRSPRFLFDIELFLAARHMGVLVDEVPVCVAYNDFKSSVRLAADSSRMLLGVLQIWMRDRLGRYDEPNPAMAPEVVCGLAQEVLDDGGLAPALGS